LHLVGDLFEFELKWGGGVTFSEIHVCAGNVEECTLLAVQKLRIFFAAVQEVKVKVKVHHRTGHEGPALRGGVEV